MKQLLKATTPFPNVLLDEAMPRLKDTEWRLLCVIVRQTLGHYDRASKARKQRDWLTREQLKARTGRDSEALAKAIDVLVQAHYIVVENEAGYILATPQERRNQHARVYYRLANRFYPASPKLDAQSPKTEHRQLHSAPLTSSLYRTAPGKSEHQTTAKSNTTKENVTKENVTKGFNQNSLAHLAANAFGKTANQPHRASTQRTLVDREPEHSIKAQKFIAVFSQLYEQKKKQKPDTRLSKSDAARLEALLAHQPELDWTPILHAFFTSDSGYVTRRDHSLPAFLDSCHIFLLKARITK